MAGSQHAAGLGIKRINFRMADIAPAACFVHLSDVSLDSRAPVLFPFRFLLINGADLAEHRLVWIPSVNPLLDTDRAMNDCQWKSLTRRDFLKLLGIYYSIIPIIRYCLLRVHYSSAPFFHYPGVALICQKSP